MWGVVLAAGPERVSSAMGILKQILCVFVSGAIKDILPSSSGPGSAMFVSNLPEYHLHIAIFAPLGLATIMGALSLSPH